MKGSHIQRGATLLETSIAIVVIGILMSGIATGLYSTVLAARNQAAISQLESIKKGIVGEPNLIPAGERNVIRYGYIGDMGSLPGSLADLEMIGSQPEFSVDELLQIGSGWRGPYFSSLLAGAATDPWGRELAYTAGAGTSAVTGAATVATIRSVGPDGIGGTTDDHVIEIYRAESFAEVLGFVKDAAGATVPGVAVKLSYPGGGTLVNPTPSTVTDDEGLFRFNEIPLGPRVLEIEPKLMYQRGTGFTTGNDRNNVEFVVENLHKNTTAISSVRITCASNPLVHFAEVMLGGTAAAGSSGESGATIYFPSRNVAGTGVIQEPFHLDVAGSIMQIPDAIVGVVGTGGTLKIGINDFEEFGTSNNIDMTGVTLTLEFSDGSKTSFAPVRKP